MRTKFCFFSTFNNFLVLLELEELARKNLNKFCINVSSTKQFVLVSCPFIGPLQRKG